jgi:hypothetical protein
VVYIVYRSRRWIGQSKPWDKEGRWSHVQTNRKEPFLEYQKEDWDRKEKNTKSRALLGDQKEGMDEWQECGSEIL